MPDQFAPNFEQVLEQDMQRLAAEVKQHRERKENMDLSDQELLKKSIQSLSKIAPPPLPSVQSDDTGVLPAYATSASAETKLEIEYLLELALKEGIEKANKEARGSNPFVLDAFHDALTNKLYPELQKRGLFR